LEKGLKNLEQIRKDLQMRQQGTIPGQVAFELYDTYGFPLDLTSLIARENGLSVDEEGFEEAMKQQKTRSRSAAKLETGDWVTVYDKDEVEFVGYDSLTSQAKILKYRQIKDKTGNKFQLVLDKTPFYAESGGQVGDRGILFNDSESIKVLDTKKENDLTVHFVDRLPDDPEAEFECQVDSQKRFLTMNNHTATHLLQAALKKVLGDHVQQKGSMVNEHLLRFDFSHYTKLSEEEINEVERIVNQKIRENVALSEKRNVPIGEAKEMGATALFGEKYGDLVRVVTFDPGFSVELCGGTHVKATGEIGFFKIISESSISAGVRRVEAITSAKAEDYVNAHLDLLKEIQEMLKNPRDLKKAVADLITKKSELEKEIDSLHLKETEQVKEKLKEQATSIDDYRFIHGLVKLPNNDALKKLAFELKNEMERLVAVLAADINGKPQIAVVVNEVLVEEKGLDAGQLVRQLAKEINGGGGGQPFFATAGGKDISGLRKVLEVAESTLRAASA
jgi:alanyl-tRNA synthetase